MWGGVLMFIHFLKGAKVLWQKSSWFVQFMTRWPFRGYGGHGNLGLGDRRSHSTPQLVEIEPVLCLDWSSLKGLDQFSAVHSFESYIHFMSFYVSLAVSLRLASNIS